MPKTTLESSMLRDAAARYARWISAIVGDLSASTHGSDRPCFSMLAAKRSTRDTEMRDATEGCIITPTVWKSTDPRPIALLSELSTAGLSRDGGMTLPSSGPGHAVRNAWTH